MNGWYWNVVALLQFCSNPVSSDLLKQSTTKVRMWPAPAKYLCESKCEIADKLRSEKRIVVFGARHEKCAVTKSEVTIKRALKAKASCGISNFSTCGRNTVLIQEHSRPTLGVIIVCSVTVTTEADRLANWPEALQHSQLNSASDLRQLASVMKTPIAVALALSGRRLHEEECRPSVNGTQLD